MTNRTLIIHLLFHLQSKNHQMIFCILNLPIMINNIVYRYIAEHQSLGVWMWILKGKKQLVWLRLLHEYLQVPLLSLASETLKTRGRERKYETLRPYSAWYAKIENNVSSMHLYLRSGVLKLQLKIFLETGILQSWKQSTNQILWHKKILILRLVQTFIETIQFIRPK